MLSDKNKWSVRPDRQKLGCGDSYSFALDEEPKTVYVAASVGDQSRACRFALKLIDKEFGLSVSSHWLRMDFEKVESQSSSRYKWVRQSIDQCEHDLRDLVAADTLVVLADRDSSTGGFWFEMGYWLGMNRGNVIMIGGTRENVFCWHPDVRWFANELDFLRWLRLEMKARSHARLMANGAEVPATDDEFLKDQWGV